MGNAIYMVWSLNKKLASSHIANFGSTYQCMYISQNVLLFIKYKLWWKGKQLFASFLIQKWLELTFKYSCTDAYGCMYVIINAIWHHEGRMHMCLIRHENES